MAPGRTWGKGSATKWLFALLCFSFVLGMVSVFFMRAGLIGLKAQGQGTCEVENSKKFHGLGRWDDGPTYMYLNWHVCEREVEPPSSAKPDEWKPFGKSWYKIACGWMDFKGAEKNCASLESHLVSIGSQEENDFVQELCGYETCFIGLTELPGSEDWVWADGQALGKIGSWQGYSNWNPGEPNNYKGVDESIAFMNGWFRLDMPNPSAGVCPSYPRQMPTGTGTWNDIRKDARVQYSVCEMKMQRDQFCEAGWLHRVGGLTAYRCYKRLCAMYDYWEAADACKSLGAELVSIGSPEENMFVQHICGHHTCRIGLSEVPGTEEWHLEDGRNIGKKYEWKAYTNWAEGEPNNWGGHDEDTAVMNSQEITASMKKAFLFQRIVPGFKLWAVLQIAIPIVLLVVTCFSSRCNSTCLAQALCITAGVSSVGLAFNVFIFLFTASKVDNDWPGGSTTLFVFLAVVGAVQIIICCAATAKAQELQWATTVAFSAMGVREVSDALQPEAQRESGAGTEMRNGP